MKKVLFVAFHGPAFSGKDTCVKILNQLRLNRIPCFSPRFAEPIYEMIRTQVPEANSLMSKEDKERPRVELGGLSIRQMAVAIGEGARTFDKACWINLWMRHALDEVVSYLTYGFNEVLVLVPDMRKPDEKEAFHKLPELLKSSLAQAWPESEGTVEAHSVLVHIQTRNAPVNEQFDAATETPMRYEERDLVVMNDHAAGLDSLAATLAGTFGLASHHPAHALFHDLFELDRWREAVDALNAEPVG